MSYQAYICHHGIKGMKWGVRRFRRKDGSLTSAGKKRYNDDSSSKSSKKSSKKKSEESEENEEPKEQEKKKLTKTQKALLIGGAVVAAYATYKFLDSGAARQLAEKGKAALTGNQFNFKKNESLASKDFDVDGLKKNVVDAINPKYGQPGTKNNCRRCTFAYEMRRRGYDVSATKTTRGTGQNLIGLYNATHEDQIKGGVPGLSKKAFSIVFKGRMKAGAPQEDATEALDDFMSKLLPNNISKTKEDYGKTIFDTLSKQPNGARGELSVRWMPGGVHSIAWEIVNGKPVIFDCQTKDVFDSVEKFSKYSNLIADADFTRLDNIDLNSDFLMRWLRNA